MSENGKYPYRPLPEPIPITEQEWPDDVLPLVHTRTMTYNHENYIRDCIEGILMQKTTFPVQVLIHDDASTDRTVKIISEYEERYPWLIKAYYQTENSYSNKEKKKVLREEFHSWRKGKYEAICEGDDYWTDPLKLQKQLEFMKEHPNVILSCHSVEFRNAETKTLNKVSIVDSINRYLCMNELILGGGGYVGTQSIIYRKSLTDNLPDFYFKSPVGDYPLMLYAKTQGDIYYLKDVMAVYRVDNPKSAMGKMSSLSFIKNTNKYYRLAEMLYEFDRFSENSFTKTIQCKTSQLLYYTFRRWKSKATIKERIETYSLFFKYLKFRHKILTLVFILPIPGTINEVKNLMKID